MTKLKVFSYLLEFSFLLTTLNWKTNVSSFQLSHTKYGIDRSSFKAHLQCQFYSHWSPFIGVGEKLGTSRNNSSNLFRMFIRRYPRNHILESSACLQWLPDVFGEICSYIDTTAFGWVRRNQQKNSQFFQTPKKKTAYPAHPSKGSLWVSWRVHAHWESPFSWPAGLMQGLLLLHPHECRGVGRAAETSSPRSKAGRTAAATVRARIDGHW